MHGLPRSLYEASRAQTKLFKSPERNGHHVTKVLAALVHSLLHSCHTCCQIFIHHMTKKEPELMLHTTTTYL